MHWPTRLTDLGDLCSPPDDIFVLIGVRCCCPSSLLVSDVVVQVQVYSRHSLETVADPVSPFTDTLELLDDVVVLPDVVDIVQIEFCHSA